MLLPLQLPYMLWLLLLLLHSGRCTFSSTSSLRLNLYSSSLQKKPKLPKEGGKQYHHVLKMLQKAGLVEESGTSEEQFSTNFLYIYMCTHNIPTFHEGNAVCMGRDDTLKCFGPLASLYQTGCSVLGVPEAKEEHIP